MRLKTLLLSALLASPAALAAHHGGDIEVHNPYARAVPPGAPASAAFMHIKNKSDTLRTIVSASTPAAGITELHTHIKEGEVMKMRQIDKIDIPAHGQAVLKPSSLHVMFFELKDAFKEGDEIEVTLKFANGDEQTITAPVKKVMKGMKHKH